MYSKNSSWKNRIITADYVAEMRHVVDVRQGAGYEDVTLPRDGELWRRRRRRRILLSGASHKVKNKRRLLTVSLIPES